MGRAIITPPSGPRQAFPDLVDEPSSGGVVRARDEKPDTYRDRLFKYIPAEVVTLYLGLTATIAAASNVPPSLAWVIFVAGVIATPYYLRFAQGVRAPGQLIVSTLAFIVWVFALGGPFATIPGYQQVYGAVLLPIFTFFVASFSPERKQSP